MIKKILIITPRSPFTNTGACEQDRLSGIVWFIKNGYEVRVITKAFPSDQSSIDEFQKEHSIQIIPITYKYVGIHGAKKIWSVLKRLFWPPFWDGSALEYFDKEIKLAVQKEVLSFKPDYSWLDYTYLWPLYGILRKNKIPIITRSINFEPTHFLDEDGRNPINYVRALPKLISECISFWKSDYFFSITPKEEKKYRIIGNTPISTLPLRSLPSRVDVIGESEPNERVRIGFMPSTYNVHHNKEALRFLIEDVVPLLSSNIREKLTVHITGSKFPKDLEGKLPREVIYEGFVPNPIEFWQGMDIAISPSIFGAGMQQKIFEPITLGIPTITSSRGLAGYPFTCGEMVICAETKEEVCNVIKEFFQNREKIKAIGAAGKMKARELFSQDVIDKLINNSISYLSK